MTVIRPMKKEDIFTISEACTNNDDFILYLLKTV